MVFETVSGHEIYYGFLAGTQKVTAFKEELNKINVFPVYDSDTGNNLSATLNYIVDEVIPTDSAEETIKLMADASLTGAKGNSGIIVAQFLNGLSQELSGEEELSVRIFGKSVKNSIPHAYKAVSKPVEGTILTVLKDWAEAVGRICQHTNDFVQVFSESLSIAKESLQRTPEKLLILKEANVVDAGAQGFVHFLEGIVDFIRTGDAKKNQKEKIIENIIETHQEEINETLDWRYCCEALLTGNRINHDQLKQEISGLGDSMIIAGTEEKVKIHIHSNRPQEFFYNLRKYGRIVHQKVDDMKSQYDLVHFRKNRIGLVTDSIADLPQDFIEEQQIQVIPLNLDIDGSIFLDKVGIDSPRLFIIIDDLEKFPTSSQPSVNLVRQKLDFLKDKYESIIMVSVSSEISGTWNVFNSCVEELKKEGTKISLINSRLNSGAQGLLVMKAAELISNDLEHDQIVDMLEEATQKTKIYVSVNDFNFMVRGGRVSPLKGKMAKILNLKPIVSLDENGKGISFANALSQKGNLRKIKDIVRDIQSRSKIGRYAIVHASVPEKSEEYRKIFSEMIGREPDFIQEISPIVALSAGLGAVALCLMEE